MEVIRSNGKLYMLARTGLKISLSLSFVCLLLVVFIMGMVVSSMYRQGKKAEASQQVRVAIGNITIIGDNKDLLYMGIKSQLFDDALLERDDENGPNFVFVSEDGQVKCWLDEGSSKNLLLNPPKFTCNFKPNDPRRPTAEEIVDITTSICLEMEQYMIILPKKV